MLVGLSVAETISWGILYYTFPVFLRPMEAELGWSVLLTCRLEEAVVGDEDGPMLGHRRGRYLRLGSG